ncbi:MAG: efflux RND transporter periplasmic adaptor subunit [Sphingobacteriales bacterium]|nr:MAG: efflux RND transporter periplasmic adaptor subunit [Sphingobacteriales bacterium]
MRKYNWIILLCTMCLFTACGSNKTEPAKAEESEHHEESTGTIVSLTEEQIKTAGIALGQVELKNLNTSIRASGVLSVPNQNKAFITTLYNGVIKTLLIQPGNYVRKGQLIATVVNPDIVVLQQELLTVNAEINMAETELRRQRELVEGNAAPLKNVQQVQTRLRTLQAQRAATQNQLSALGLSPSSISRSSITSFLRVTAPISGTVSTVSAQIGSNVDPSTPIAEIVNNSQLHLDLFVYEKDLPRLHKNQMIHFTLTNNPGKEYDAQIYSIGTAFANESKAIPVHAVVRGDKTGLIEGMNITALISIGTSVLPAVPTEAIVSAQGQDYIFVQTTAAPDTHAEEGHQEGENHEGEEKHNEGKTLNFERVQVVKGTSDVGYTEVTFMKDVAPRTPIVTKGAFFVMAKLTNTGGHGH